MNYKEILVFLDPSSDTEPRLELAISIASAQGARIIGVDATSQSAFATHWRPRAEAVQDLFETAVSRAGLEGVYRSVVEGHVEDAYLHCTDLIIAPQPESEVRDLVLADVPENVLLEAGVPVLILPYEWRPQRTSSVEAPRPVGDSVVIAWNSSREATRAVHDALPLLTLARKVTVFTFAPHRDVFGSEPELLSAHLLRHGVKTEVETWSDNGDMSAVEALFAILDRQEADLIVAGAYGHSRWLEGLFGGASEALLRQPSMPVLLSH